MKDTYFCFYCKKNIKNKNANRHINSKAHINAIFKLNEHIYMKQHDLRLEIQETYKKYHETEDKLIKKICLNNMDRCKKEIEDLWYLEQ